MRKALRTQITHPREREVKIEYLTSYDDYIVERDFLEFVQMLAK
jgi:hypothetical protein